MSENSIILDYFRLTKEYQSKYGNNLILLMQVGAFFEVYALKNSYTNSHEVTMIDAFSDICNLVIAEKSFHIGNDQISAENGFPKLDGYTTTVVNKWMKSLPKSKVVMAGHSIVKVDQYVQKLTDAGFTAVVYVQEKDEYDKVIERKLHAIYSPGTYISNEHDNSYRISNHIMCIWLEKSSTMISKNKLYCGTSTINIFTGVSTLFQYDTSYDMNPTTFDDLERQVSTYTPSEVIIISNLDNESVKKIIQFVGISLQTSIHFVDINDKKASNCTKQTYINEICSLTFGADAFSNSYELQENIFGTQSLCFLLNFIQEHNPDLVRRLTAPVLSNTSLQMILANHSLKQLNIIDDKSQTYHSSRRLTSISNFLNRCSTAMGRRKFLYQITHPTFNSDWLNKEYDIIDYIKNSWDKEKIQNVRMKLNNINDLEKTCRQVVSNRFLPCGLPILYNSLHEILLIHKNCVQDDSTFMEYLSSNSDDLLSVIQGIITFLESRIIFDKCSNTFDECFIKTDVSTTLDECFHRRITILNLFDDIQKALDTWICLKVPSIKEGCIKIHDTDKSGKSFQLTKKRSVLVKQTLEMSSVPIIIESQGVSYTIHSKDITIINASSNYDRISFPLLNETTQELLMIENNLSKLLSDTYQSIMKEFENSWYNSLESIANFVSCIDVIINKVYLANEFNYCRPYIIEDDSDCKKSFVDAKQLRHCLIEHLNTNEVYVPNDIYLGTKSTDGILLYGTNAVGKTSIIRALGIALVMAQSGCYVPCSEFIYKPYKAIFTRILGNDNLFKGLSTFAVEMSELRAILKLADKNSLVLGDELCSGTEIESALSIFVSGLMHLHTKCASFIFATHFHDILGFEEMNRLTNLATKHMSVTYNCETDSLIYDRIMKDGPGNRMYGLEVCKSLHLPNDFLEQAYRIRNRYYSNIQSVLTQSTSRYNSQKLVGLCEICKSCMGEEIHHIQHQQDANKQGFIGHIYKNHPGNLMSLCKSCHDNIHSNKSSNSIVDNNDNSNKKSSTIRVKKKTSKGYCLV